MKNFSVPRSVVPVVCVSFVSHSVLFFYGKKEETEKKERTGHLTLNEHRRPRPDATPEEVGEVACLIFIKLAQ